MSLPEARGPDDPGLAVVFDLDGTLVDSIGDIVGAANRLLAEEGRTALAPDHGRALVGEGATALVRRAFAATGAAPAPDALAELVARYHALYRSHAVAETTVYPGVTEALTALADAGAVLGVCTNKPHGISLVVLAELGLAGYFAAVLGGDALAVKKPDPAHFTAVLDAMGLDAMGAGPRRAIHVGDTPTDVAVARNAGVPVIAVSHGYSRVAPGELGADALIGHFADLCPAIAALGFDV